MEISSEAGYKEGQPSPTQLPPLIILQGFYFIGAVLSIVDNMNPGLK